MTTQHIPLDNIVPNPQQPRKHFDPASLAELADSIKTNGLVQPITVQETVAGHYILISGERRLRAHKLLGHATIEAVVRPKEPNAVVGERDRLVQALVENIQRQDLNPMEEAYALKKLRDMNMTNNQIAGWTGWSLPKVTARLKLLRLEPELQELVAEGALPHGERVTDALLSIQDSEARVQLGQRLARPGITVGAIEAACNRLKEALEQPVVTRDVRAPSVILMQKNPPRAQTERWQNINAAAQGMCGRCNNNPKLPNLPHPAWSIIMQAAEDTCNDCSLRDLARQNNLAVCRECPGVELLRRMVANVR